MWGFTGKPTTKERVISCVPKGWASLTDKLIEDLIGLGWDGVVLQAKEKFGTLRFYIGSGSPPIWDRINQAEKDSATICVVCGEPGELREGGWIEPLCDAHSEGRPANKDAYFC